ncbi:MAG: glycogen debranching enzyme GlgX [Spirochaetaceae bacterium]|nr:MAG: glycogen debranching enzyme GlgX [Spirochaetaceae bacterium]
MIADDFQVAPGKPKPLGATLTTHGTQFVVFSRHATAVSLVLFESDDDDTPSHEIHFDPDLNRTGDVWHLYVRGIRAGQLYLYRVDGPYEPHRGLRFNRNLCLIDPYAKALTGGHPWELGRNLGYDPNAPELDLSFATSGFLAGMPKCIVVNDKFDWQGDRPLNYPLRFSVIYEAHVKGLTAHPSSGVEHPGTYRGVTELIPYLKQLGITSLELLPVQEFDENEVTRRNPETDERLVNYWGYNTLAFFAPKASYAATRVPGQQVTEFKEMVRELHKAGIEVLLDVVFNHSGEGNEFGPTVSFRGLDNPVYYMLEDNPRYYRNYSGCGNTMNCNNPVMRTLILDCLHYWVIEMHVDGFRFDLGSILGRDQRGNLMENPPILERIAEDPVLRNTKIIAEAWDAAGAYQVGWFPGGRWAEWNDRFRDDVRRYWRGDREMVARFATRITGSSDLYLRDGRKPFHSINFVTSHDGFTLADLVSYTKKRNKANGENNTDGHNTNYSFNHGVEGATSEPTIIAVRRRQIKNMLATLLLSLGTPMLLGGDEFGRTQNGNNNAYCQDNELSWFDHALREKNADIVRFVSHLVRFRLSHPAFLRPEFYTGEDNNYNAIPDITWWNAGGEPLDWTHADKCVAFMVDGTRAEIQADRDDNDFFIMMNSAAENVRFAVVAPPEKKNWYIALDTAMASPNDIHPRGAEPRPTDQTRHDVHGRSVVVLLAR